MSQLKGCELSVSQNVPTVSVIVPCRNESAYIECCVRSILRQELPEGGLEVIIADGMSDDGTREILQELTLLDPRLSIIDNIGRVVSTGLNSAIQVARGRVILRMDAHTTYAQNYICECVAVLEETEADNVGGPWVARGEGFVSEAIAVAFQSPFAVGGARGHDPNYEGFLDTVYLGCWPREVFDRVGFFDEELVRNQDDEFNLRLIRAKGKVWQSPRIKSWYCPRESLKALFQQYKQYGYWKVRVIQKHKMPASVRHVIPGVFVLSLIALPLLALWWPIVGWGWLGLTGAYLGFIVLASAMTAGQGRWKLFPILPLVFACYHIGYGYGFLRGVWDFCVLRGGPSRTCTELTRPSDRH